MSNSLRDQMLQLGFTAPPKPEPKPRPARPEIRSGRPGQAAGAPSNRSGKGSGKSSGKPGAAHGKAARKPRQQDEIDLGKAYAIRAQKEKEERMAAERAKQEAARVRREARARLAEFLRDKSLNDPAAEITRHFEYGGKIKRIHVNEVQLKALNAGEFGVVQLEGRYLLVTAAVLDEAEAIFPQALALRVDPNAPAAEVSYADPKYQVPDDLVW